MNFNELAQSRRSHRSYVVGKTIPQEEITSILKVASLSPSSSNMQGWKVIALTSQSEKERLHREACKQQQVLEASVVFVIFGDLEQYENLKEVTAKTPSMDAATQERMYRGAHKLYSGNAQMARDEAVRSAALFGMCLMFAAAEAGYGTGPMIGFDAEKLVQMLGTPTTWVPALMVTMGVVKDQPYPRGYRLPVESFTTFI